MPVRFGREPETVYDGARTEAALADFLDREADATKIDPILLFDGCDHQEWDQEPYAVLARRLDTPDERYAIRHSSPDDYLADKLAEASQIGPQVAGELRAPGSRPAAEDVQRVDFEGERARAGGAP